MPFNQGECMCLPSPTLLTCPQRSPGSLSSSIPSRLNAKIPNNISEDAIFEVFACNPSVPKCTQVSSKCTLGSRNCTAECQKCNPGSQKCTQGPGSVPHGPRSELQKLVMVPLNIKIKFNKNNIQISQAQTCLDSDRQARTSSDRLKNSKRQTQTSQDRPRQANKIPDRPRQQKNRDMTRKAQNSPDKLIQAQTGPGLLPIFFWPKFGTWGKNGPKNPLHIIFGQI